MNRLLRWLCALAMLAPGHAAAQIVSRAPDRVAVTIYRAPERAADAVIDRQWLRGYALITEQRRIHVASGRQILRFEGVAAGILPESAIVTGLPDGVREKNLDADLLSPGSLYARGFGRPVTIRREIGHKTVELPGIIRSGPDGAAILQTRDGFEAVNCGPQTDSLIYAAVPPDLSAKPTLSVQLDAPAEADVTVTLSYLAWGFDWQANYVATLRPDGRSADLTAWVTLASSDTISFANAETMVVAGRVKREGGAPYPESDGEAFEFHCFGNPSDFVSPPPVVMAPPPPPAPAPMMAMDIVVTGSRARAVTQEDLGDLKLYRVPERTTVAALAQKQVLLLDRAAVPVRIVYVTRIESGEASAPQLELRMVNRADSGLGVPLPAGPVALLQPRGGTALLIGEGSIGDKAIGEEVEAKVAAATNVTVASANPRSDSGSEDYVLTVRNANPYPVAFEGQFDSEQGPRLSHLSAPLVRKDGKLLWALDIPANGTRTLRFRLKDRD